MKGLLDPTKGLDPQVEHCYPRQRISQGATINIQKTLLKSHSIPPAVMLLFLMSLRHNNYSSKSKKSEFFSNTSQTALVPHYLLSLVFLLEGKSQTQHATGSEFRLI